MRNIIGVARVHSSMSSPEVTIPSVSKVGQPENLFKCYYDKKKHPFFYSDFDSVLA